MKIATTKTGPKTILDKELLRKIKIAYKETGEIRKTAKIVGINDKTLYCWRDDNYLNLTDQMNRWDLERQLEQAESFSKRLLAMVESDSEGVINTKLVSIKQREAEFLRSTLLIARNKYDKRENLSQGTNVQINVVNYNGTEKPLQGKDIEGNVAQ